MTTYDEVKAKVDEIDQWASRHRTKKLRYAAMISNYCYHIRNRIDEMIEIERFIEEAAKKREKARYEQSQEKETKQ